MWASVFTEKWVEPNDAMLTFDLANTKNYLERIVEFVEREYGNFMPEWQFYNQNNKNCNNHL